MADKADKADKASASGKSSKAQATGAMSDAKNAKNAKNAKVAEKLVEDLAATLAALPALRPASSASSASPALRPAASALSASLAEPIPALEQTIRYLEGQRTWLGNYAAWQEAGYPVGSGLIERAVALVINWRMKGRGMRWCRGNASAVVALRVHTLNTSGVSADELLPLVA